MAKRNIGVIGDQYFSTSRVNGTFGLRVHAKYRTDFAQTSCYISRNDPWGLILDNVCKDPIIMNFHLLNIATTKQLDR